MNTNNQSGQHYVPNVIPNFSNFYLPFNPAYVELPEAKAEDLT